MIRTLLQKRLMEVRQDEELGELGFGHMINLQEYTNNNDFFERLWVSSNKDDIQIVVLDEGNGYCKVIAFLDEFLQDKKVFNLENGIFDDFVLQSQEKISQHMEFVFEEIEELLNSEDKIQTRKKEGK